MPGAKRQEDELTLGLFATSPLNETQILQPVYDRRDRRLTESERTGDRSGRARLVLVNFRLRIELVDLQQTQLLRKAGRVEGTLLD